MIGCVRHKKNYEHKKFLASSKLASTKRAEQAKERKKLNLNAVNC